MDRLKLKAVLGSHPHVQAVKSGELRSDLFDLDFIAYTPTNTAFKPMVREQGFDVCEMAIVTYLMAKAHGKPLVLLPATMLGRFQHSYALYNPARGALGPSDLEGKRVGIRSFTTTTGAWIRGILANDYGVNLDKIRWVTFEDPHVAEYIDTTEIDAVVVLQNAADPAGCSLAIGAHADTLAGKAGGRQPAALDIVQHGVVLKPRQHRRRQQGQALGVLFRLQIGDQRHLAGVVGVLAHHRLERRVHRLDLDEVELERRRRDLAALERQRVRIVADGDAQGRRFRHEIP